MKTVKLIITLFAILASKLVSAHALWIETDALGTKGKQQEVKIYYGEYSHNIIEPLDKWYSDVKDFKIYVISPSLKKTEISKTVLTDYYAATFTPTEVGTYTLLVEHPAKEPYETTAFEFSAIAKVNVGNSSSTQVDLPLAIDLEPKNYVVGDIVRAKVIRKNIGFANAEVEVVQPDGWVKKLITDDQGMISFKIPVTGKYLLEVTDTEDKNTKWFGKLIEKIWRANTTVLFVK